jgi:hypothetical protein
MVIAYWTTDPVNEHAAREIADRLGASLDPCGPRDELRALRHDGAIFDLDSWPADRREEMLYGLLFGGPSCPAAVHSYNLNEDEARALRRRGVAVSRHLDRDLFLAVCPTLSVAV